MSQFRERKKENKYKKKWKDNMTSYKANWESNNIARKS